MEVEIDQFHDDKDFYSFASKCRNIAQWWSEGENG